MAIIWHPSPTVAEHLAAIRSTPATDRGWRINGSVRTPSGITVPAAWLLEEFPELAQNPLPPFLEGCAEAATGRRWLEDEHGLGRVRQALLVILNIVHTMLIVAIVVNVLAMAARGIPLLPFAPLVIGFVVASVLIWFLKVRRSWTKIPQAPTQMLLSKDKLFLQDFRVLPLGGRDLLLGSGVALVSQNQWGRSTLAPAVQLFFFYFWFFAGSLYLFEGHRWVILFSFLLATTADLIAQFRQGLGAATTWTAAESYTLLQCLMAERRRRAAQSFPRWWTRLHRLPRWVLRWLVRQWRIVKSERGSLAMFLWNWPLLAVLLVGWGVLFLAAMNEIGAIAAVAVSLLFFVLARSPFVCRGERSTRYLARRHLEQYDRLIRFHRRWQQREEGKVVKG